MKYNFCRLFKINILILTICIFLVFPKAKVYAEETFIYSDAIVDNLASATASEIGCGNKDEFIYQLIWSGVFINQYNFWYEGRKPSTVTFTLENMCTLFSRGSSYTPKYCNYTFDRLTKDRGGCKQEQINQLRLAARMVLSKSFNIPSNIYYAAEEQYAGPSAANVWISFQPKEGGWKTYYSYQKHETLSTKDVYGNTIRTDEQFYRDLANCLYANPTLYGAYNKCPGGSSQNTSYFVYLYPNGGKGIEDGYKYTYNTKVNISELPNITKDNCTLNGWNIGSTAGELRTQYLDEQENGQKMYANWSCQSNKNYTVTFKYNDGTDATYYSQSVTENAVLTMPKNPTKEGYTFSGWLTQSGEFYNTSSKVNKDFNLYAYWVANNASSQTNSSSHVVTDNPQTGSTSIVVYITIVAASIFGFLYYHKYYLATKTH